MPRFKLDVDDQFNNTLSRLAEGCSKADVIRKAIATYQFLKSEAPNNQSGKRVSISDAGGEIEKVVILP
jgi:hypothetical protein